MSADRYHASQRVMHWLMAAGFIFMWACGYSMTGLAEDESPLQEFLFGLHISVGVTLLFLLAARIVLRLKHSAPPLPPELSKVERKSAALGHFGLYLLPLIIITSGWAETNTGGHGVEWFGVAMPKVFPTRDYWLGIEIGEALETIHHWAAYIMLGLACVHVAAVVKHRRDGHDVLRRITLGRGG